MPTIKELRALPGESRVLTGYLDSVVIQEPTEKDIEKGQKAKPPYIPKTKYHIVFAPNRLESRKVKFDPEQFPVKDLKNLEAAFVAIEAEVKPYEFTDDKGEVRKGETAELVRVRAIYRDANGDEPKR